MAGNLSDDQIERLRRKTERLAEGRGNPLEHLARGIEGVVSQSFQSGLSLDWLTTFTEIRTTAEL